MYKREMTIILAVFSTYAWVASASEVPDGKLKQFQKGTQAVAAEVNANFESLRQAINDNSRRLRGSNLILNANFDAGQDVGWSADPGSKPTATFNIVSSASAPAGAQYVLSNQESGVLWLHSDTWITLEPAQTYEVMGWFHRSSAEGTSGTVYLAVLLRDKDQNNIRAADGGAWWYYPANGETPGANWLRYQGIFGYGTRKPFPNEAVEMTVGAILNYNGTGIGDRVYQTVGLSINKMATPEVWQNLPLEPGWTVHDEPFQPPQYRMQGDSVCLRGLADRNSGGELIATLPPEYHPTKVALFKTAGVDDVNKVDGDTVLVFWGNGRTAIRLRISDGDNWVSLDQICWSVMP